MKNKRRDWVTYVILIAAVIIAGQVIYWYLTGDFVGAPLFVFAVLIFVLMGRIERLRSQQRSVTYLTGQLRDNVIRGLDGKN